MYGRFNDEGFIFHDLRRTFATDAIQAGVPQSTVMEITGHSRGAVFDRYSVVSFENMREGIERTVRHRRARLLGIREGVSHGVYQNVNQMGLTH